MLVYDPQKKTTRSKKHNGTKVRSQVSLRKAPPISAELREHSILD